MRANVLGRFALQLGNGVQYGIHMGLEVGVAREMGTAVKQLLRLSGHFSSRAGVVVVVEGKDGQRSAKARRASINHDLWII